MTKKNLLNPTEMLCIQAMAAYIDTLKTAKAVRLHPATVSFCLKNAIKKMNVRNLEELFEHPRLQQFLERNPFVEK